ncbi:MAG: TIGR04283 family arsenosugar biosynthesis glycosyltransferase [Phycisphaeraceae bacterium]
MLAWISRAFAYERDVLDKPVLFFVTMQMAAGLLYLFTLWLLRQRVSSRSIAMTVMAVGLVMRLSQMAATPILETDQYRYLWDGAVTAHGFSPYAYAPNQITSRPENLPDPLRELADESGEVLSRINHPSLRTIYPPTAQAAFAVGHWIEPFGISGLRWTWLGLDLAVAGMLLLVLRGGGTSVAFSLGIYWLNPLLIKEVFNSGHMELVLIAATIGALLAAIRHRTVLCMILLGLATGAKVWPVLWLPLLLRNSTRSWPRRTVGLAAFAVTVLLLAYPIWVTPLDATSGFAAYAQRWQMNDSAYLLLHESLRWISPAHGRFAARMVVAAFLLLLVIYLLVRHRSSDRWVIGSTLAVTSTLFLLSPTQFPWYYLWILPLLTLRPLWSLLGLTVTLPLYYLRFPLDALGHANWFDYGLVWIEFVPIWLLLAVEWRASRPAPLRQTVWEEHTPTPKARVAVVIPALNEELAIGRVLAAIPQWVSQVVVADNGSTDETASIAKQHGATVVQERQRGYGAACLAGIAALESPDIVVFLDGDFSDHPQEMSRLVEPIVRDEADMVIGSRALGCAEAGALTPQQRFGNALACWLIRLIYGVRYTDLGPFRAIRHSSLRRLAMDDRDYGWTVQMQVRAARQGLRVREVPVSYRRRIGKSKISGTIRGVIGAGTKIISTIIREGARARAGRREPTTDRLLIFGRFPEPGRAKTRLIPLLGPTGAALLHQQLLRIALDTVRRLRGRRNVMMEVLSTGAATSQMASLFGTDLAYRDQGEGDLGQRLRHAALQALTEGAERIVLIGTDCPLLDTDRLDQAFAALDDHDVVIGPALDGGYYLIGVKSDHAELFTGIAWGGPTVLAQTLEACRQLGLHSALLPALPDVDTPDDLAAWAAARLAPAHTEPRLSVIIPARNEQDHLAATLASVLTAGNVEILVVDGRSTDRTIEIARQFGVSVIASEPSRGVQLNAGAAHARSNVLLFLHADTLLPSDYLAAVRQTLAHPDVSAGAFGLAIDARGIAPRLIEWGVNVRSRVFGRPYGDQALFMSTQIFRDCNGFPNLPFMEDYSMLFRLKARGRIRITPQRVSTSARRWKTSGWLRTTLAHQWMIVRHHFGHFPDSGDTPVRGNCVTDNHCEIE